MNKSKEKSQFNVASKLPIVDSYEAEMSGNSRKKTIVLRNVARIRHFPEEEIRLARGRETVVLAGRNLDCRIYAGHALCVEGDIVKILFEKE